MREERDREKGEKKESNRKRKTERRKLPISNNNFSILEIAIRFEIR